MRTLVYFLSLILTACSSSQEIAGNKITNKEFLNNRSYLVERPDNFDENNYYKLLLAFHGAYGSGVSMRSTAAFEKLSNDYIVVYPEADTINWEEGCKCNITYRLGIDDIAFISSLVDSMQRKFKIIKNEVYGVGYSQGGLFAHNVACKLSKQFKAIAVVAAPMSLPLAKDCEESQEMNILMIQGTLDNVLPYDGFDDPNNGRFSLISASDALIHWAKKDGYDESPTRTYKGLNNQIEIDSFKAEGKSTLCLISIVGGGHSYHFTNFNTSQEILDFFEKL